MSEFAPVTVWPPPPPVTEARPAVTALAEGPIAWEAPKSPEILAPCLTPADVRAEGEMDSPANPGAIGGDSSVEAKPLFDEPKSARSAEIVTSDVLEWARTYDGPKFHALLCDPPYHLTSITERFGGGSRNDSSPAVFQRANRGFMGQEWDGGDIAFRAETWAVLKQHLHPGAFLMAFAGTRGYHRMACAIEDAGFIIHPLCGWTFGSGFPKATRIDTQIDRDAGAEREAVAGPFDARKPNGSAGVCSVGLNGTPGAGATIAATPLAQTWEGHRYGLQSMKPALECVCVAQVPYEGRPVDCITETGAGALNIEGGRIGSDGGETHARKVQSPIFGRFGDLEGTTQNGGRWPANFALVCACETPHEPHCPVAILDAQSGSIAAGHHPALRNGAGLWSGEGGGLNGNSGPERHMDSGGASRFFHVSVADKLENEPPFQYCAKPDRGERDAGLGGMLLQRKAALEGDTRPCAADGVNTLRGSALAEVRNPHPTLKPLDLCKWLSTLLLPPPEYGPRRLLVPFAGTGTEAIAASLVGWEQVVGIEQSAEYADLARARVAYWLDGHGLTNASADAVAPHRSTGAQLDLFAPPPGATP